MFKKFWPTPKKKCPNFRRRVVNLVAIDAVSSGSQEIQFNNFPSAIQHYTRKNLNADDCNPKIVTFKPSRLVKTQAWQNREKTVDHFSLAYNSLLFRSLINRVDLPWKKQQKLVADTNTIKTSIKLDYKIPYRRVAELEPCDICAYLTWLESLIASTKQNKPFLSRPYIQFYLMAMQLNEAKDKLLKDGKINEDMWQAFEAEFKKRAPTRNGIFYPDGRFKTHDIIAKYGVLYETELEKVERVFLRLRDKTKEEAFTQILSRFKDILLKQENISIDTIVQNVLDNSTLFPVAVSELRSSAKQNVKDLLSETKPLNQAFNLVTLDLNKEQSSSINYIIYGIKADNYRGYANLTHLLNVPEKMGDKDIYARQASSELMLISGYRNKGTKLGRTKLTEHHGVSPDKFEFFVIGNIWGSVSGLRLRGNNFYTLERSTVEDYFSGVFPRGTKFSLILSNEAIKFANKSGKAFEPKVFYPLGIKLYSEQTSP